MEHSNEYTIYFGDAKVLIASEQHADCDALIEVDERLSISRAKLIKKVETNKFMTILTPDPGRTFTLLAQQFVEVRAAGGVVVSEHDELLMIFLRCRWDLPKGHIEEGESSAEAARREVREETGIEAEVVGNEPLMTTLHAYDTYGRWELKSTDWWVMRPIGGELCPQTEEGICGIGWYKGIGLTERLYSSYATINEVVAALSNKVKNAKCKMQNAKCKVRSEK